MKRRCPICGSVTGSETHTEFPFCGERCRLLDLGNWASEKYVISDPAFDEDALRTSGDTPPAPGNPANAGPKNHADGREH